MTLLPSDTLIPARNRRQAMDWSLVLVSQGIEHTVQHDETTGWALAVAAADQAAALAQIQQYRLENQGWHWRRSVFQAGVFFDGSAFIWVLLNVFLYGWSAQHPDFQPAGMMTGTALGQGEWWRLFTATWLHADLAHLAGNMVFGFLFLGLVMGKFGPGTGMLAAYLAGAGGNWFASLLHDESYRSLGASGVVMGALGLLAIPSLALLQRPSAKTFRFFTGSILAGLLLWTFLGTSPEADVAAHLGGFLWGLLLGALLSLTPVLVHRPCVNLAAALTFTGLVILPWCLALASVGHDR